MNLQKTVDLLNEAQARTKSHYHLTFGELIKALEKAPKNAVVDKRFKGIGSWRGSYVEIAIFTKEKGLHAEKSEFNDYDLENWQENYDVWHEKNVVEFDKLPRNANELAKILKEIKGLYFVGYKGGNFQIEDYKPLWLTAESCESGETAIIGIDENLKFITKVI